MKGRTLSILGIFAAVVGAILILCNSSISLSGVTITCGILFVGVGLVNLIFFSSISKNENAAGRALTMISNAAAIMLGVTMLVFESSFSPLISFMFGLLVSICALWQFFVLAVGARPYQLPAWLYIFPVLLIGGAVYVFLCKYDQDSKVMLGTGISMAVFGIGCLIEGSALGIARRNFEHAHAQVANNSTVHQTAPTVDVEPVNVTAVNVDPQPKPLRHRVETTEDLDDIIEEP